MGEGERADGGEWAYAYWARKREGGARPVAGLGRVASSGLA